ncbi:MAG TPA: group III truncated hemoglobin [Pyrinomonadaceae bacterium]|jgi:hemoglobin
MKKDIQTRSDIDNLMNRFYARAMSDEVIGYIFTGAAKLDLEKHLPIIGDFWETLILGANKYQKRGRNPMQIHALLNLKTPLQSEHFRRWLEIFRETVDESFAGEQAESAKIRAEAIANRMLNFVSGVSAVQI